MKSYLDNGFLLETGSAKQLYPEHAKRMSIYDYLTSPQERVLQFGAE